MPRMPGNELPACHAKRDQSRYHHPSAQHVLTCFPYQPRMNSRARPRPPSQTCSQPHPRPHRPMNCPSATQNAINRVTPSLAPTQHVLTCFPYQPRIHSRAYSNSRPRPRTPSQTCSQPHPRSHRPMNCTPAAQNAINRGTPSFRPTRFNVFPVPDANSFAGIIRGLLRSFAGSPHPIPLPVAVPQTEAIAENPPPPL